MGPFGVFVFGTVAGWILRPTIEKTIADAVKRAHSEAEHERATPRGKA
jgi:hypothetical protein